MRSILLVRQLDKPARGFFTHRVDIGGAVVVGIGLIRHNLKCKCTPDAGFAGAAGFRRCKNGGRVICFRNRKIIIQVDAVELCGKREDYVVRKSKALRRHFGNAERLHAVLRIHSDLSACTAGGPAVFVVKPCFEPAAFTFVGARVDQVKPFAAEILRDETGAGMHKKAAESHVLHDADLTPHLVFTQFAVPRPERLCPVRAARIAEKHRKLR